MNNNVTLISITTCIGNSSNLNINVSNKMVTEVVTHVHFFDLAILLQQNMAYKLSIAPEFSTIQMLHIDCMHTDFSKFVQNIKWLEIND